MGLLAEVLMAVLPTVIPSPFADDYKIKWDKTDTIIGIDINQNGIRDDFERSIRDNFKDETSRNLLYHAVHNVQQAMNLGSVKTKADVAEVVEFAKNQKVQYIYQCLPAADKPMVLYIDKEFPNTKMRKVAYKNFNEILKGNRVYEDKPADCTEFVKSIPNYVANEIKD